MLTTRTLPTLKENVYNTALFCVAGVRRLIGMVNFIARFTPNLSEVISPLRELLKKDVAWHWDAPQQKAFTDIKELLQRDTCLAYYDVKKPVKIQADACKNGLGAVLIQEEKPVAYASRAMTPTQIRYAMIEKELLAVVFGCERFHQYIYAKQVVIENDHKPLETIFKKPLYLTPPRLQRMLLRLQKYDILFTYKRGREMLIADTLSRAYLEDSAEEIEEDEIIAMIHMVTRCISVSDPVMAAIKKETKLDADMQKLQKFMIDGWPVKSKVPPQLRPYMVFTEELYEADGLLMKGPRIIIPAKLRKDVLSKLHKAHLGMEKTKQRARETVYYPGISRDIEEMVERCRTCQDYQNQNPRQPMVNSEVPTHPWQVVGCDLFHWNEKDFVLAVDYYSRYIDIEPLDNMTAPHVVKKLKLMFSRFGIPETVRPDNGPCFKAEEYKRFAREWHFNLILSDPYYPRGNGLAERSVQTVKKILTKSMRSHGDPYLALLELRNTPVDSLSSPSKLLMGRNSRSVVPSADLSHQPVDATKFQERRKVLQQRQKKYYDRGTVQLPDLVKGDGVMVYDTVNKKNRWRRGIISKRLSDRSYSVTVNGREWRRNRQHLRKVDSSAQNEIPFYIADEYDDFAEEAVDEEQPVNINEDVHEEDPPINDQDDVEADLHFDDLDDVHEDQPNDDINNDDDEVDEEPQEPVARSTTTRVGRQTQVPQRYGDYTT